MISILMGRSYLIKDVPIAGDSNTMTVDLMMPHMRRWLMIPKVVYIRYYFSHKVIFKTAAYDYPLMVT